MSLRSDYATEIVTQGMNYREQMADPKAILRVVCPSELITQVAELRELVYAYDPLIIVEVVPPNVS